MSQYYFLVASLPLLNYEQRDAVDPQEFLALLAEHLGASDLTQVRGAAIDAPQESFSSASPTIRAWAAYERGLRNAIVRLRAARLSTEPGQYLRADESGDYGDGSAQIGEAAREAMGHDSPLSAEDALNRARWLFLDELEVGHYFDLEHIVVYYLRLQILARRRRFDRDQGQAQFERISEQIMNDYYQEQSE